jgi:hypothetical protein
LRLAYNRSPKKIRESQVRLPKDEKILPITASLQAKNSINKMNIKIIYKINNHQIKNTKKGCQY